jgi:hypothetical protein
MADSLSIFHRPQKLFGLNIKNGGTILNQSLDDSAKGLNNALEIGHI